MTSSTTAIIDEFVTKLNQLVDEYTKDAKQSLEQIGNKLMECLTRVRYNQIEHGCNVLTICCYCGTELKKPANITEPALLSPPTNSRPTPPSSSSSDSKHIDIRKRLEPWSGEILESEKKKNEKIKEGQDQTDNSGSGKYNFSMSNNPWCEDKASAKKLANSSQESVIVLEEIAKREQKPSKGDAKVPKAPSKPRHDAGPPEPAPMGPAVDAMNHRDLLLMRFEEREKRREQRMERVREDHKETVPRQNRGKVFDVKETKVPYGTWLSVSYEHEGFEPRRRSSEEIMDLEQITKLPPSDGGGFPKKIPIAGECRPENLDKFEPKGFIFTKKFKPSDNDNLNRKFKFPGFKPGEEPSSFKSPVANSRPRYKDWKSAEIPSKTYRDYRDQNCAKSDKDLKPRQSSNNYSSMFSANASQSSSKSISADGKGKELDKDPRSKVENSNKKTNGVIEMPKDARATQKDDSDVIIIESDNDNREPIKDAPTPSTRVKFDLESSSKKDEDNDEDSEDEKKPKSKFKVTRRRR